MAGIAVAGELYFELDGQLAEIKRQLRQPNGYPFDPGKLKSHLQAAIEGRFQMTGGLLLPVDYSIAPSLVNLKIETHPKRTDVVRIDMTKVERVLALKEGDSSITGHENLERLQATGRTLLDVRVLEELWKNKHLIPESWKQGVTYFWGTIFRDGLDGLCVACLCWVGSWWRWGYGWLGSGWDSYGPAACLASEEALAA